MSSVTVMVDEGAATVTLTIVLPEATAEAGAVERVVAEAGVRAVAALPLWRK